MHYFGVFVIAIAIYNDSRDLDVRQEFSRNFAISAEL